MNFPGPSLNRSRTDQPDSALAAELGVDRIHRLANNESILGPSPKAVAAIQAAAAGLGNYPRSSDSDLRAALAATWGRGLTADHFYTGCSGYETIELATRAFLRAGDEMIVSHPTFMIYNKLAAIQGATLVDVPLLLPNFQVDIDGILAAVTPQTRILLLCNPNNPTGTVMPAADMDQLVMELPEQVLIVTDEVYIHFVEQDNFPDSLGYVLENRPIVQIHSFSKAYGLAGLRLGYAIAPPEIASYIAGHQRGFHQNQLALAAGMAALQDDTHMRKNVQLALEGKRWLYTQFDDLDLAYVPSQTNFVVLRLPKRVDSAEILQQMRQRGILLRAPAGLGLDNCLRISVGSTESNQFFIQALREQLGS